MEFEHRQGLHQILESKAENLVGEWEVTEEYPENMVLGPNLRSRDEEHVPRIAESILSQGQLQECVGDTLSDGRVRVWAGQHRFWAVELINNIAREEDFEPRKLRVRVYLEEFSSDKIFEVQLSENLHQDMRPEEEAEAIESLWNLYERLFEKKSRAGLARRIGRGETKVRNALKFCELDTSVKELVSADALLYSIAVELARLPKEKQLAVGMKIVMYNFDRPKALKLVRSMTGEEKQHLLFPEVQGVLEKLNHRIAFRTAADRAAKDASGYFKRIIRLINLMDDPRRAEVTEPIRNILSGFIESSDDFRQILKEVAPHLVDELEKYAFKERS